MSSLVMIKLLLSSIVIIFQTTLQLFLEMEHVDLLSETKLDLLQHIMEAVCPMLNDKINHFKEEQGKLWKVVL